MIQNGFLGGRGAGREARQWRTLGGGGNNFERPINLVPNIRIHKHCLGESGKHAITPI